MAIFHSGAGPDGKKEHRAVEEGVMEEDPLDWGPQPAEEAIPGQEPEGECCWAGVEAPGVGKSSTQSLRTVAPALACVRASYLLNEEVGVGGRLK